MMIYKLINLIVVLAFILPTGAAFQNSTTTYLPPTADIQQNTSISEPTGSSILSSEGPLEAYPDKALDLTRLSPFAAFTIHFNQAMDPASAEIPLVSYPYTDGTLRWSEGNTTLTFTPSSHFSPGEQYTFYLDSDLMSQAGSSFADIQSWVAMIESGPQVVRVIPTKTDAQDRRPGFMVSFSSPMDAQSVTSAISIKPDIPFTLSWQENDLAINLGKPLDPGKRYSLTIAAGVKDKQGIPMFEDYRWDYYLEPFHAEVSAPKFVNAITYVSFNYSIDVQKTGVPFSISPAVDGEWEWNNDRQAKFVPMKAWDSAQRYTVSIEGTLYDQNGEALPRTSEVLAFVPPPPIRAVFPKEYIDFSNDINVFIMFDQPMDRTSVENALQISPSLPGTYEWQENKLILHANPELQETTTYQVTLQPTVKNAKGHLVLEGPYKWSFRINYYPGDHTATFADYGPNAQVVDSDGRRAIQLVTRDIMSIHFTLYGMELMDFAQRYAADFGQIGWSESHTIDTTGMQAVNAWQEHYLATGINEVLLPKEVPPGLYVLEMSSGGTLYDKLFVILTKNTLVVKRAGDELLVWASDINGKSLPNYEIRLYSSHGEMIRQGETNPDGVYRTSIPTGYEAMIVAGRDGSDVTISGLSYPWSSTSSWWYWWNSAASQAKNYTAYTITDRPIYRPGDTVSFKTSLRQDDDMVYTTPPKGTPLTVRILDAKENALQTYELTTNEFGSAVGEFNVAEGAMLGDYSVEVLVNGEAYEQVFKVQDYRKPDFQVSLAKDSSQYVAGDPVKVDINVSYYFGEPVPNAVVTIRRFEVLRNDYWWWDEGDSSGQYRWTSVVTSHSGRTDANGHLLFSTLAETSQYNFYSDWRNSEQESLWGLEVTASDGSNQHVTNVLVYSVYNAAYKLTTDTGGYLKKPGQSFTVHARLTTLENQPVISSSFILTVRKWKDVDSYDNLDKYTLSTDAQGQVEQSVSIAEPGYYSLVTRGPDGRGHEVSTEDWIYVYGEGELWANRYNQGIQITADQKIYRPGNQARFIIESTFSGPALLTFERGSVINYKPIMLTAPVTIVEAEVTWYYSPNVYVAVNAWEGQNTTLTSQPDFWYESLADSQLRRASTEIQVEVVGKRLEMTVTPDQPSYAPGEEATFTIRVTDEQGKPVEAEVTLSMVDEAIYALSSDLNVPIFDAFFGRRSMNVDTFDSMALTRELFNSGAGGGGGGDYGGSAPRSDFPDTAIWLPMLKTDMEGKISVPLTLPDSLTTWRLTARAITVGTQVGETTARIVTQKELVVRPVLPAALTTGDQSEITAFVHNYGENTRYITATLTVNGLVTIDSPLSQVVQVEAGGIAPVKWAATATGAGTAQVVVAAEAGDGSYDAVQLPLTVNPIAIPDFYTQTGDFKGELRTTLVLPENALEQSDVEIRLSRSAAGTLLDGLEYLTGYPYGCVEQTMSRALPNAVVGRALNRLGVTNPKLEQSLPGLIRASVQKLYGLQHSDGGWGWWHDDISNDYQTAWVIFGLATTREAGYDVDEKVIQSGAEWLLEHLEGMDIRTRAYTLYSLAMAGSGDLGSTQSMLPKLQELDTFSQASLALALYKLGDEANAVMILESITQTAAHKDGDAGELVFWPQPQEDGDYHRKTMSSTVRTTALVLDAYARIDPQNSLLPGIVRYLMGERKMYGWGSTNETAYTIIALTDHLAYLQRDDVQTAYRIELNSTELVSGSLGVGQPSTTLTLPASQLKKGANILHLAQDSDNPLYYTILSRMYLSQGDIPQAGNIAIERTYLDTRNNKPVTSLEPGQVVRVRLTINIKEGGSFIIVEDKLPGGMEALNESLNTTSYDPAMEECYDCNYSNWERYGYNNKEVHPDRVSFFITQFKPGEHTIIYLARVTHAGTFVVMPAEAYAMYDDSTWGRSASRVLNISTGEKVPVNETMP